MKRILIVSSATLVIFNVAFAQKMTTILGDAWKGEVVATDDSTREITIKYEVKGETQTFIGVLVEGYQVKRNDGSSHELKVSEMPTGTRVCVFSKPKSRILEGESQSK